ncbi:hypothetical protein [Bacillus infantis]|uniref:Threonine dehydratase n=1 Tax=Bacillus infantis TaxID=324767 RepID=A0A5D4RFX4_9BACI|nr:hypothetical protein [Bacillus infantis]TYS49191.1 hypothetical protein FZD51_08180 [Bacillus infantis]
MEFSLCSFDSRLPVEVTADEDNGRYMIRKADTSGEVFNNSADLLQWVKNNFREEDFCDPSQFRSMLEQLEEI